MISKDLLEQFNRLYWKFSPIRVLPPILAVGLLGGLFNIAPLTIGVAGGYLYAVYVGQWWERYLKRYHSHLLVQAWVEELQARGYTVYPPDETTQ